MRNKRFKMTLFVISILALFFHCFNLINHWSEIPHEIPIHFSNGTPDNWGPKYILFIIPVVSIVIWLLLNILASKPEKLNYVNLTEANKETQFSRAQKVIILIQNFSFISFILANDALLKITVGMESGLLFTIAIILLIICFILPVYLMFWASTLKY